MGYKLGCCVCLSFFFWKMGRIREGTTTMTDEHAKQLARSDATEQLPSNETTYVSLMILSGLEMG